MKILLFGATGQLGSELIRQAGDVPVEMIALSEDQIDITDPDQTQSAFNRFAPDLAVNAAAYTNVDKAESEPEKAFGVNRDGTKNLAAGCADSRIPMIHVSTDYVFDGKGSRPYGEDDTVNPMGVYGESKAAGEQAVRSVLAEHIIIRTSWLYGVYGQNFVKTMIRLGKEGRKLSVVSDQFGSPTSAADLADAILSIADAIHHETVSSWGTYHYTGKGITTWYRFAESIFRIVQGIRSIRPPEIQPVPTSEYPADAQRPAFSGLNCDRIIQTFGVEPRPWQESLETAIKRIFLEKTI